MLDLKELELTHPGLVQGARECLQHQASKELLALLDLQAAATNREVISASTKDDAWDRKNVLDGVRIILDLMHKVASTPEGKKDDRKWDGPDAGAIRELLRGSRQSSGGVTGEPELELEQGWTGQHGGDYRDAPGGGRVSAPAPQGEE